MEGTLQQDIHELAKEHGFWEGPFDIIPQKLALIHSEVSEALEAWRDDEYVHHNWADRLDGFAEELADIVIRTADLAEYLGIELADVVAAKHNRNIHRPFKHNKRF